MRLRLSKPMLGIIALAVVVAGIEFIHDREASHDDADGLSPVLHTHRGPPAAGSSSVEAVSSATGDSLVARTDGLKARLGDVGDVAEIFDSAALKPPPPPPPPPPKPHAPPFPYTIMGAIEEQGIRQVFLSNAQKVIVVKAADTFDGVYRVESLDARRMTLTYLPLQEQESISLGPQ